MKLPAKMNFLIGFSGTKLSFIEKFEQYTHFIVNCFVSINGVPGVDAWQLKAISSINILGIVMLILVTISFILNRKDKLSRISYYWTIFSFVLLCIVGWGTKENGLVLYSLYFSWALVVLMYNLLKYIFDKLKISKYFKYCIICIAILMLIYNLYNLNVMITWISQI